MASLTLKVNIKPTSEIEAISSEISTLAKRNNRSEQILKAFVDDFLNGRMVYEKLFNVHLVSTSVAGELDGTVKCSDVFHGFVSAVSALDFNRAVLIHKGLLC